MHELHAQLNAVARELEQQRQRSEQLHQQQQHVSAAAAAAARAPAAAAASDVRRATKIAAPSNFSGSALSLDSWLRELQQQFDWYRYNDDADRVALAGAHLRSSALDWWHSLSEELRAPLADDYAAFVAALRGRFQPVNSAQAARIGLDALRQSSKQSVHDYISAFNRLLTAVPSMAEEDRLHRFTTGLRADVQREVVLKKPATLSAAIDIATRVGSLTLLAASTAAAASHSAASSYSSSAMDVNALDLNAVEGLESESDAYGASAAASATPASRSELQQLLQQNRQLLHALQQRGGANRDGGRGGRAQSGRGGRAPPRVAGLSAQQVRQRLDAGQCFNCGEAGHQSRNCPSESKN